MELQMAPQVAKSTRNTHTTPPHHHHHLGGGARPVPGYLRPSTSTASCHHVCKYGGTHEFEENNNDPKKKKKNPRKPPPPPQQPASSAESQSSRVMVKVRSVFRRRVVSDSSTTADDKRSSAAAGMAKQGGGEAVGGIEWKDIVVDDTTTVPKANAADVTKSIIKPPKGKTIVMKKKKPTSLVVEEMAAAMDQEALHGYDTLSPSVMQSRVSLLRDLEEETAAVHGGAAAAIAEEEEEEAESAKPPPPCPLNEEEYAAVAAAETKRPIVPAHRRAKSMSIGSRSVRFPSNPIARQASKNSGVTFKLRSRSTKAPIAPPEMEEKPATARMRSRRGGEDGSSGSIRGIQLRIRSLRRRGLGGGSGGVGAGGFVVPAVALRHQKTLEKKKSQRLYNNVIEETASKLVKTRKSRVKALVGAFESVISKIAK